MKAKVIIALVIIVLLVSAGLLVLRKSGISVAGLLAPRTSGVSAKSAISVEPDRPHPDLADDQAVWVWGPAHAGFTLSVRTLKDSYRLGEAVSLHVAIQNVSGEKPFILAPGVIPYRIALYDATGNPVAPTELWRECELEFYVGADLYNGPPKMSAGQILTDDPIDLTKFFTISKAGHYYVVVMRRIGGDLSRGFLVSNMGMITIEE